MGWPGVASLDRLGEEPGAVSVPGRHWPEELRASGAEGAVVASAALGALHR